MRHLGEVSGKGKREKFVVRTWGLFPDTGVNGLWGSQEPGPLVMIWVLWDSP